MGRVKMKKIIIGICFILILVLPSTVANLKTLDNVNVIDDLPDLIVKDIYVEEDWWLPLEYIFVAKIQNIGISPAPRFIETRIIVKRLLFGLLPIKTYFNESNTINIGKELAPGETVDVELCRGYEIPIGFNKFYCTVNPNQTIEEAMYSNNNRSEKFFGFIVWYEVRW
jgi:hypothetical protein